MSMISDEFSYCHVTPADYSIVPAVVSMSATDNHQFYIKINTEIIHPSQDEDGDEDEEDEEQELPDYMRMVSSTREFEICIPVDQLYESGPHTSWSVISQVGLPVHIESMLIDKICSCAQQMALENQNVGSKVLPMFVSVSYVDEDYQAEEYMTDDNFVTVGASESVIESLEKVTVEILNFKCAICLEGMEIGTEAKKIACEHRFHGDCIVDWLRVSNLCPLCRFRS